jgi:excisionase family DNA binding protein
MLASKEITMSRTLNDPTIPSDKEALLAREASHAIEKHKAGDKNLRMQIAKAGREVTTLELPAAAVKLLIQMLEEMGKGNAVSLVPTEAELTTQQAADLLNVSRPYLVGMIDKGELPARMVGNQRRLPLKDVLAYKTDNRAKRIDALREMKEIDQELGLR